MGCSHIVVVLCSNLECVQTTQLYESILALEALEKKDVGVVEGEELQEMLERRDEMTRKAFDQLRLKPHSKEAVSKLVKCGHRLNDFEICPTPSHPLPVL